MSCIQTTTTWVGEHENCSWTILMMMMKIICCGLLLSLLLFIFIYFFSLAVCCCWCNFSRLFIFFGIDYVNEWILLVHEKWSSSQLQHNNNALQKTNWALYRVVANCIRLDKWWGSIATSYNPILLISYYGHLNNKFMQKHL